jgi:RimJ/RimL family protein N-acetyltransferase
MTQEFKMKQNTFKDIITPVKAEHARELFPYVFKTKVVDTIQWNGPENIEDFTKGLKEREIAMSNGDIHLFTIIDPSSNKPAGSIDIRIEENLYRADVGLWIGEPFQGKGLGSQAIQNITRYGFDVLKLEKIEASIFVGNTASRKAFEAAGYSLEGTIRSKTKKYDQLINEWVFGIIKSEFQ